MILKPHKACDVDLSKLDRVMWIMPKIDGVRALHFNGAFQSRTLKPFPNTHLMAFDWHLLAGLDGELVKGSPTSGFSCRDTTSGTSTINGPRAQDFTWHIFDCVDPKERSAPYAVRYEQARSRVEMLKHVAGFGLELVPYEIATSVEDVLRLHAQYVDQGYEGSILRDPQGLYKSGRATVSESAFLRLKDFIEEEAEVLEVVEGEVNNNVATINKLGYTERSSHKANKVGNGMVGSLRCRDLKTGQEIMVSAGRLTHEERKYFFENTAKILGRIAKYRAMPYGKKDLPRFPTFQCFREAFDL